MFWIWVHFSYVWVYSGMYVLLFLSLEKKLGMTGCSSGTRCGWIRLGYTAYTKLRHFCFFFFFSHFSFPKGSPNPPAFFLPKLHKDTPPTFTSHHRSTDPPPAATFIPTTRSLAPITRSAITEKHAVLPSP